MHLAGAVGVPLAALFGPTRERETAPLAGAGGRTDVLINHVWCRPCMLRECPLDHRCMNGLSPDRVMRAVTDLMTDPKSLHPDSRAPRSRSPVMSRPAVFLDRDGTIIEERGYLDRLDLLALFPWTADAIRLLNRAGFATVVITNQAADRPRHHRRAVPARTSIATIDRAARAGTAPASTATTSVPHLPTRRSSATGRCAAAASRRPA